MPVPNSDPNADVIAEFRASGGAVKADYDDPPPMLLLHTSGAKSGREHVTPMRAKVEGDSFYVFASAHGSPRNPDWYHNLMANPEIIIEVGAGSIPVRATELAGREREAIFDQHAERFPIFAEYQRRLDRRIPVIRLDRRDR